MLPRIYRTESEIRKRQITTLKVFNDNVAEVQEGCEYQVLFTSGRNELCFQVLLTTDFPNDKPILKISPAVIHPWVNKEGEVTSAPGLLNFTVHSDLGRVVQAIIREFERTPPPLASDQISNNIISPTLDSDTMGRRSPSYVLNYSQNFSPPHSNLPIRICQAFPELNVLSLDELQFLNDSTDKQDEFVENLPYIKDMSRNIDEAIAHIEQLANSNLSKKEHLEELKEDINVKIEEVTKLAFENERLNAIYQNLSEKYSPRNIQEQLRVAAEKADAESEKIADSFLKGNLDVDKFVSMYLQTRTLNQTRKTKDEKLSQQLESLEKAGF